MFKWIMNLWGEDSPATPVNMNNEELQDDEPFFYVTEEEFEEIRRSVTAEIDAAIIADLRLAADLRNSRPRERQANNPDLPPYNPTEGF